MNEKIKKLIDYEFSQRQSAKNGYERGYINGRIKGLQDVLAILGDHYDPIYKAVYGKDIVVTSTTVDA